jgi:hypothetical protein
MRAVSTDSIGARSASEADITIFPLRERGSGTIRLHSIVLTALNELEGRASETKAMPVFTSVRTDDLVQGSWECLPARSERIAKLNLALQAPYLCK